MMDAKIRNTRTQQTAMASLLVALTSISAWIQLPTLLAPITLQTFFTYLAGNLLIPQYAFLCQLSYVLLGLAGLPVFSSGGGVSYLSHPTFGYILAMPIAALVIATVRTKRSASTWWSKILNITLGAVIIFAIGVFWLYGCSRWLLTKELTLAQILWAGTLPFIPGEAIKIILAAYISTKINRVLKENNS